MTFDIDEEKGWLSNPIKNFIPRSFLKMTLANKATTEPGFKHKPLRFLQHRVSPKQPRRRNYHWLLNKPVFY